MSNYVITSPEEESLLKGLEQKTDSHSMRIKRYLAMPDLSRKLGSPIHELVQRITTIPAYANFDIIQVPEIMSTKIAFDLFDFPKDHPTRSKSDTYYVDEDHILRTQTTVMWYYYFLEKEVQERLARKEPIGVFCYGKVYRKDEIDNRHMNVFHQIDALYIAPKKEEHIDLDTLKDLELKIVKAIFGEVESRFAPETFPYTHPSTEIEIKRDKDWLEILGSGVVKPSVLEMLGVDPEVYNGWAFGSGIERWAMISMDLPDIRLLWSEDPRVTNQLKLGQKFVEVSKYPPIVRDISFVVKNDFVPNDYFDFVRELAPGLIEQVELLDKYENAEKFGADKISYAYRITYRSLEKTLTSEEIDQIHKNLESETAKNFEATIR